MSLMIKFLLILFSINLLANDKFQIKKEKTLYQIEGKKGRLKEDFDLKMKTIDQKIDCVKDAENSKDLDNCNN